MKSSTYCRLAHEGLSLNRNGQVAPCCNWRGYDPELGNFSKITWKNINLFERDLRPIITNELDNGIQNLGCKGCWDTEHSGGVSIRQKSPISLHIYLGRLCNLQCIMCGPYASSIWADVYRKNEEKSKKWMSLHSNDINWFDDPDFVKTILPYAKKYSHIEFSGGEPIINPVLEDFLDGLIEENVHSKTKIVMNTNLFKAKTSTLEKLSRFNAVKFNVSLEGTKLQNDYLRFPSKWEEIVANIDLAKSYGMEVMIVHVFQHSSVYTIPSLVEFCHDKKLHFHIATSVQGKPELELEGVPTEDIKKVCEWASKIRWLNLDVKHRIKYLSTVKFDSKVHQLFRDYIEYYDSITGMSWDELFNPSSI